MLIIPAIDILKGNIIRLRQGKEKTAIVYSKDPLKVALEFQQSGARWIHVVDLDGAFGRPGVNDAVLERLIRNVSVPIQLGGGIRTLSRIGYWLNRGIGRVVLGSAAAENPNIVEKALGKYGNPSIVVGMDIRDGCIAIHGWEENTQRTALELARKMKQIGLVRVVVTDIRTDGMLRGPKLDSVVEIAEKTGLRVIVSGGVGSLNDLAAVADEVPRGIEGVIVGKALYEKKFTMKDAVERFQE